MEYKYKDVTNRRKNGVFLKWQRINIDKIPNFLRNNKVDAYATIQRYASPIHESEESFLCPLYFDFDGELDDARRDVKRLASFLSEMGIADVNINVAFSGSKGFHLTLDEKLFGSPINKDLIAIYKLIASEFKQQLDLNTLDMTVYSRRRMWRLENSVNSKTGKYCIPIYVSELTKDIQEIVEMANYPREPLYEPQDLEITESNDFLVSIFNKALNRYQDLKLAEELNPVSHKFKSDESPVCIKSLLNVENYVPHTRNKSLVAMATYYKDAGIPLEEAIQNMIEWSKGIKTQTPESELISNAKSVANTIYGDDQYHFSCAFIRSISSNIQCLHEKCPVVDAVNQIPKNTIKLSLFETTNAVYIDKPLSVNISITGTADAPFVIPREVTFQCNMKKKSKICEMCPLKDNEITLRLKQGRDIIKLINIPDRRLKGELKALARIPQKCTAPIKIDVKDYHEVWEIIVSPNIKSFSDEQNRFINRFCYYFGHNVEVNKNYNITCTPIAEPKKQKSVLIINSMERLEDDLSFNYEEDEKQKIIEQLSIFQVEKEGAEGVVEKIYDIARDISNNVTEIYERLDMHIAIDLVYHSPLSIQLPNTIAPERGKMELIIIGDSGQAKSTVFNRMQAYYGAGMMTSGEASKRTGLVYSIKQYNDTWVVEWGLLVMQDRRLLCIDEFSETPAEEKQQLTQVRSSGIAECSGVVKAKAHARTRLILLTNPHSGDMSGYDYGVESIWGIFKAPADIRRLDLMLVLNKDEISSSVYNQMPSNTSKLKYTSDKSRLLLRFAWSRKSSDIIFTDDAVKSILNLSTKLADKYLCDIPLTEKADMRYKLARIGSAVAIRVFSVDDDLKVIVKKEHIEFAYDFIDHIYSKPSMAFDQYAKSYRKQYLLSESKYEKFLDLIKRIYSTPEGFDKEGALSLLELFQDNRVFTKSDIADMSGLDKSMIKMIFGGLGHQKFLKKRSIGFYKTNAFVIAIKRAIRDIRAGKLDDGEDDIYV